MQTPESSPDSSSALPWWKRSLDITCCMVALPLLAVAAFWAFLITSFASRGPIFFRQERIGHRGRIFLLYKFRTMHVKASVSQHEAYFNKLMTSETPMQKLDAKGDKRLIPGGWILRATGLDELPQIINVLKGEMSIVGPRPCIPYEFERYLPWQQNRLKSVPGLTGLWQVSGKNRTTFNEMVRLDIAYGARLSLREDLRIILKTPSALWTQFMDTRMARRKTAAEGTPMPSGVRLPNSATFVARTQNVISGTRVEDNRHVTRQPQQTCVSFRASNGAKPFQREPDQGRRV